MHHYLPILLQIAIVYLIALVSPGPNFFMITQLSLAGRRGLGAASALGVGTGSTIWASLAMLGFATVLQRIDWLYNGIRIAGAIYLVWFGIKLVHASAKRGEAVAAISVEPSPAYEHGAYFRAWRSGMLTCLTNPKSCAFWTSIFATLFPAHPPLWFYGIALAMIASMSVGWYGSVALMFATERTQRGYRRLRRPIDGLCGAVLVGLGAKLAAES
ncbi:LysE family transporter [Paraburkholderia sp. LEh10]|uniref:LysE family translocator n=1 Tax=Paraburkholderia sp. LEh10 TaxID=2821353 RepID=UPI001AE78340|nr:LysE family transporter [Paraburkholderia sp. LEh10]MBP0594537.1 LysE family transporter [Paraburkholderia sp. LEh10]